MLGRTNYRQMDHGLMNVRSMYHGKLELVKKEQAGTKVDIIGIGEFRWTGSGHIQTGVCKLLYSGNEKERKIGVAFLCSKSIASSASPAVSWGTAQ